jgi:hypothetical protein
MADTTQVKAVELVLCAQRELPFMLEEPRVSPPVLTVLLDYIVISKALETVKCALMERLDLFVHTAATSARLVLQGLLAPLYQRAQIAHKGFTVPRSLRNVMLNAPPKPTKASPLLACLANGRYSGHTFLLL